MANPYVFGGSAFGYEEMTFPSQPYGGLENSLGDSNLTYIDPTLQAPSPTPYSNTWATPVQQSLKGASQTALFVADMPRQARPPNHTPIRPTLGIPPVPPPSQVRFASPISSIEPSSSGSVLSPPADTESYYDNFPRTPPDTALLSPFQAPLPLEPSAHAMQFTSMGPDYVNLFDVNPSQQSEYPESDNSVIDFINFSQPAYGYESQVADRDAEAQSTASLDFAGRRASSERIRPMAKDESQASSQYPPLPRDEDVNSDDETAVKRQKDDDTDGDYQPNKRQRTSTRAGPRRSAKTSTDATSSSPRRPKIRASNRPHSRTLSSSANPRALTCPDCKQRNFSSQLDFDAHIRKQHLRPFNCVFDFAGCESTFASKNEWKRHVLTQHLLLFYWACPEGSCAQTHPSQGATPNTDPNNPHGSIFNRKDLFTQHLKRMHCPKQVKDALADAKRTTTTSSSSSTTNTKPPTSSNPSTAPTTASAITAWNARVKTLQTTAMHPRCHLPTFMRCPVPGCTAQPFRGHDAWNQRMEHVAKHMDRAAQGREGKVVFGGVEDETLVEWASRGDVGIIVPGPGTDTEGGGGDGRGSGWVLESPLKRGPGGNVVVNVTAGVQQQQGVELGGEGEEIVVLQEDEDEEGDEDAEGEEDD
jgi:hypothetical protein